MNGTKRRFRVLFAVLLSMSAFGAGSALAGNPERQAVKQACKDDFRTYCKGVQPGGGRIKACLQQNFDKLSPGCQDALKSAKASRQAPSGRQ